MRILMPAAILSLLVAGTGQSDDYEQAFRLRESGEILPLEELLRRLDLGADMRQAFLDDGQGLLLRNRLLYVDEGGGGLIPEPLIGEPAFAVFVEAQPVKGDADALPGDQAAHHPVAPQLHSRHLGDEVRVGEA